MREIKILPDALDVASESKRGIGFLEKQGQEQHLLYGDLKAEALGILGSLQKVGVRQGDQLVISVNDNPVFIRVFWACMLGGIIPVPVGVGISQEHRNKLLRILGKLTSPWLLSHEPDYAKIADSVDTILSAEKVLSPNALMNGSSVGQVQDDIEPDDIAFIQFSSGSTSDPKGVVLSHSNLLANINGIIKAAELTEKDISLSWMPLTHDMGLIGFHLTMLVLGMQQYLMPTDLFSRRPLLWLDQASKKKATILCSPNFGYKHYLRALGEKQPEDLDLRNVRSIFNGAEPISVPLIEKFMQRMAAFGLAKNTMSTVYGLAEASLAVCFPKHGDEVKVVHVDRHALALNQSIRELPADHLDVLSFVVEGQPVHGCQLRLTNAEDQQVGDGVIGRIQISGTNVMSGYYRDEQNNAVSITSDGWVDTGDLGFICEDGLVVTGRDKDIIFAHGLNYYPHDLENILVAEQLAELGKVVAAGYRDKGKDEDDLLVFVLYRKDADSFREIANRTKRIINEKTGLEVTHVLPVKRVPKTTSGKIQRRFLVDDYATGNFSEFIEQSNQGSALVESENEAEVVEFAAVEGQLKGFVDQVIPDKALALDSNFFDAGISSLALAEIHQKIEDQWPGLVDIVDLFDHQTIAEVATFIDDKLD